MTAARRTPLQPVILRRKMLVSARLRKDMHSHAPTKNPFSDTIITVIAGKIRP